MKRPLFHIGYQKTGSTWLQRNVIDNAESGLHQVLTRKDTVEILIRPYPLYYDASAVREAMKSALAMCADRDAVPVVTHERLSGNAISGGHDATLLADRLHGLFPDARVLLVVREQLSMLRSIYAEYVQGGGACSLRGFMFPPHGVRLPLFDFQFLEFHHLARYYEKLFGRDNMIILPFEALRDNPLAFANRVLSFLGEPPLDRVQAESTRRRKGAVITRLERYLNFFFSRDSSNPSAPFSWWGVRRATGLLGYACPRRLNRLMEFRPERFLPDDVRARYAASNKELQRYVADDLASLGYML